MCKGKPDLAPGFIAWLGVSVSPGKNRHKWTGASSTGLWEEIASLPGVAMAGSQELLTGEKGRHCGCFSQRACDWRPCLDLDLA